LINKNYFQDIKPRNTLKTYSKRNLSEDFSSKDSLNNMIINSNLENEDLIK